MESGFGFPKTTITVAPMTSLATTISTIGPGSNVSLTSAPATTKTGMTFGSGLNASVPGSTTATSTAFSLPSSTAPGFKAPGTGFGILQPTTTAQTFEASSTFRSQAPLTSLPGTSTTTTGFSFGFAPTSTTTGFNLDKSAAQTFSSAVTTTKSTTSLTAPVTSASTLNLPVATSTAVNNAIAQVNFAQLEENINKWTLELEEQEKVFMNQVAHINEWDRLLLSNGDKIISLNNSVEKVKLEQQQLDHELDFIVAQQRELEECLLPLEREFANITVSDPERDATYRMAENLNTQLRHMSEDLKEIIEDINEKNKNHDTTDPIVQIGRILNAHMNSLQWVDLNTRSMKLQLDAVTKLTEIHKGKTDSTQNI